MTAKTAVEKGAGKDGRTLRAERLRKRRRQQILACARRLFAERGYHATSVGDIIARAGTARGTFYLHFPSKRALLDELINGLFIDLSGTVKRIEVGDGAPPPTEQMEANVLGVVTLLLKQRDLTRILLRETGADAEFDRKLEELYGRLLARIAGGIRLGQEMGLVRSCDVAIAATCVLGGIKELMYRFTVAGDTSPQPSDLAKEIRDYVLYALFRPPHKEG